MKIFSSKQLYEADEVTCNNQNITSVDLMERAGSYIFTWLHQRMQGAQVPVHIFCGIGNNGGDGLVLGRLLIESGYNVKCYIANFTDKRSPCFLTNYSRYKDVTKNWPILMKGAEDFPEIAPQDIIIDALFGIGLNRPPEGWVKDLILHINTQRAFKLSIDIPSGLSAEQAVEDFDAIVKSNHTLTFQAPKLSFFLPETGPYVTFYEAIDIGLDAAYLESQEPLAQLIAKPQAQRFYKQRNKYAHKGNFGHSLIVAGSYGMMGASVLATKATMRIGAGKVTAMVPRSGYSILQSTVPEAMVKTDENEDFITNINYDFEPDAIAVGMGIGNNDETATALKALLKKVLCPIVIDADALNCISKTKTLIKLLPENAILTPHPGELARLVGEWTDDYDKIKKCQEFSATYKVIIIIKGANTITVMGNELYINTTGNPGMATAGSGDVLSGCLSGLLAQGYDPLLASVFGVYLHGSAGNIASQTVGFEAMMASDIINSLGDAFLELFRQEEEAPVAQ
ncbi:bifunctional NAD(P)H-hydrate repair enzyme [Patiriisocius marinistellae]|uniref:Bifunctional NAD(P)H-hydrate repair enzyme n=1 Tax=Patiriisocius marinistellae TaxID=2494560 RepID=A0A5J4FYM0_9FLAO|nr:NAD(P)H-hydrate dehydratase [Patiriisocius marinistellae]GEQ86284.1 bifunctional NAD(P)H-hydrate repair enzyme [Patiriisocius marinistellae]